MLLTDRRRRGTPDPTNEKNRRNEMRRSKKGQNERKFKKEKARQAPSAHPPPFHFNLSSFSFSDFLLLHDTTDRNCIHALSFFLSLTHRRHSMSYRLGLSVCPHASYSTVNTFCDSLHACMCSLFRALGPSFCLQSLARAIDIMHHSLTDCFTHTVLLPRCFNAPLPPTYSRLPANSNDRRKRKRRQETPSQTDPHSAPANQRKEQKEKAGFSKNNRGTV
mmetsp:Transcript_37111/g.73029  ORF Transcript_37111/g.73029 Transcript_37111/m.73029 type:complete len:220 (+) Transcript_37111:590-1249(+)